MANIAKLELSWIGLCLSWMNTWFEVWIQSHLNIALLSFHMINPDKLKVFSKLGFFHLILLTMSYVCVFILYKMAYTSEILCYDCWAYIRSQFKSIDAFLAWRQASTVFLVVIQLMVWKRLIIFKGSFKMPLRVID